MGALTCDREIVACNHRVARDGNCYAQMALSINQPVMGISEQIHLLLHKEIIVRRETENVKEGGFQAGNIPNKTPLTRLNGTSTNTI